MLNVAMSTISCLSQVDLPTELEVNLVVQPSPLLQLMHVLLRSKVDVLHRGPQCTLGRHEDFIWFFLLLQPQQSLAVRCLGEVPTIC